MTRTRGQKKPHRYIPVLWTKRVSEKTAVNPSRVVEKNGHQFVYVVNVAIQYSTGQGVSANKCSGLLIKTSVLCCCQQRISCLGVLWEMSGSKSTIPYWRKHSIIVQESGIHKALIRFWEELWVWVSILFFNKGLLFEKTSCGIKGCSLPELLSVVQGFTWISDMTNK